VDHQVMKIGKVCFPTCSKLNKKLKEERMEGRIIRKIEQLCFISSMRSGHF